MNKFAFSHRELFDQALGPLSFTNPILHPIPGHDGYFARADGAIFSTLGRKLRRLSEHRSRAYMAVKIAPHSLPVHRVVALAFLGLRPEGMEVCHCNGDPHDNRPDNLRYDTHAANMADSIRHGRHYRGGPHRAARKLSDEQVIEVRARLADSQNSVRTIAAAFDVTTSLIYLIRAGKTRMPKQHKVAA